MKIIKHGVIHRVTEGPFRYQAWPTVCVDENGTLYAACSGHRLGHICPFGKNLFFTSNDGGETWSCPSIATDTWFDDRDAGLTYLGNGKILLQYFHNDINRYLTEWKDQIIKETDPRYREMIVGALETYTRFTPEMNAAGAFVKISEDRGRTWGEPIKVPITSPHGPVKTVSGRLLLAGREFYSGAPEEDKFGIFVYESFDEGKSWEKLSKVEFPEGCGNTNIYEPHIIELPDGKIIVALRGDREPVFEKFSIFFAESLDGGKTFSKPWATELHGAPPHMMLLPDGAVLISFGSRRNQPYGIRAVISRDGCKTFEEEMILTESYSSDLGYPATTMLPDGTFITVYYQRYGQEDGNKTSIMYTKWEL